MKIAWVTPLAQASAIGRMGVHVCEELVRRGHDVTLIRSECDEELLSTPHATNIPVASWRSGNARDVVQSFEAVFVNVGDNFRFHAGIFPFLETKQVVGIFHDFFLYNLFRGWLEAHHASEAAIHDREIVTAYGTALSSVAEDARSGRASLDKIASAIPMTEWVAGQCAGAIAHSRFYLPRLTDACFGPVLMAALPWPGRGIDAPLPGKTADLTAVTVGIANPNKCSEQVVRAIGASSVLRERLTYVVAGAIAGDFQQHLEALADQLGVRLKITGKIDDATLLDVLGSSDIICCLRKPVLEGASASAIEGMLTGRPILVANAGFYSDLPGNSVLRVSADVHPEELTECLEHLVLDEQTRLEIGRRGKAWAERTFTVDAYSATVEAAAERMARFTPFRRFAYRMAAHFEALEVQADDTAIARICQLVDEVLPSNLAAEAG